MLKFIKVSLLVLTLIGTTVWAVLAVYFGDSHSSIIQTGVAAVFGLFGLVTLAGLGFFALAQAPIGHLFNAVYCSFELVVVCCESIQ